MKSEEIYIIPFNAAPQPYVKYGFGSNQTIQTRRTKKIIFYPFYGVPFLNMVPALVNYQNQLFTMIEAWNLNSCLISIASRDGGYIFIDCPLSRFNKSFLIHDNLDLNAKVNFNLSYVRFTSISFQPTPFVIPFSFRLHDPE